jgi:hypothetical protein
MGVELSEMYVFEPTMFMAPPIPPQLYVCVCVCVCVNTLAEWNATFCPKCKAIGEELSESVSGSTPSSPDGYVVYRQKHARIGMERCVQI